MWHWMRDDGAPLSVKYFAYPQAHACPSAVNLSMGELKAYWHPDAKAGRQSCRMYWRVAGGDIKYQNMFYTRLAQGLFGGRVDPSASTLDHEEAEMEHITDQPHRWDLDCIQAGSPKHNKEELDTFNHYMKFNPSAKTLRDKQLEAFNKHMHDVISKYQVWPGVPEACKCKLRDELGKYPPKENWEINPSTL